MSCVVRRHELSDAAWARIEPLLPAQPARGGRWADHRTVLNGMLWKSATGAIAAYGRPAHPQLHRRRRDLPARYQAHPQPAGRSPPPGHGRHGRAIPPVRTRP
ncbi:MULTISPECIES: transposase [Actinomadura]|uniref:Transposase n=1 Tax=Actinomadura yumaensis TaxID=111807 RepID=A0ABW2CDT9_9ACTN|nr:transposase [Actinomadura sp. J1-007]